MNKNSINILNGDGLLWLFNEYKIDIENPIIMRECLIIGPKSKPEYNDFFAERAKFIEDYTGIADYNKVISELEKIHHYDLSVEINLWFENDLFCQVNMWWIIKYLISFGYEKINRIYPSTDKIFTTFHELDKEQLLECQKQKKIFRRVDKAVAANLWNAFELGNTNFMQDMISNMSKPLPHLDTIVPILAEFVKNEKTVINKIKKIIKDGFKSIDDISKEFSLKNPEYGFGDFQIQMLCEKYNLDYE